MKERVRQLYLKHVRQWNRAEVLQDRVYHKHMCERLLNVLRKRYGLGK